MSLFHKESAFEQADEQRAKDQRKLDNFPPEPPKVEPVQKKANPELSQQDLEAINHDLGLALQHLEGGNIRVATQLIEETRDSVYRWLR